MIDHLSILTNTADIAILICISLGLDFENLKNHLISEIRSYLRGTRRALETLH